MFFTYLWQSKGLTHEDANGRFSSSLLKQCKLYKEAFGQEPNLKIKQLGNVFIGQIYYESGIEGWEPWNDMGEAGLVWGGVCENYLGKKIGMEEGYSIINILQNSPKKLVGWNGMFSVIAWDGNRVSLTTAATECPTLWSTEGPNGWAAGSRATPLLEMVGRTAVPDMGALGLYLQYGYFIGGHSSFDHVSRIHDRQQIIIEQKAKPRYETYVSLKEYLGPAKVNGNWNDAVSYGVERIMRRVDVQLKHSLNPVVLLTGGRDSRAIAAAAKKTGRSFITATSGPSCSEDVMIAAEVSDALGVKHQLNGTPASADLFCRSTERLKLWARISEGIIPLNFCLNLKDFLAANLPFPSERAQFFHGHEPNIGRCIYYPNIETEKMMSMNLQDAHQYMTHKNPFLKLNTRADDLLQDLFCKLDNVLFETRGGVHEWFELLYWRERGLTWGMDLQSIYSPIRSAWMPLFDRDLMTLCRDLTIKQKKMGNFLVDVSVAIEPALAKIRCTPAYSLSTGPGLSERIKRRIVSEVSHYAKTFGGPLRKKTAPDKAQDTFSPFWELVFLNGQGNIWREFIEEADLKKLIRISPQNDLLWRLLTIELLAETYF